MSELKPFDSIISVSEQNNPFSLHEELQVKLLPGCSIVPKKSTKIHNNENKFITTVNYRTTQNSVKLIYESVLHDDYQIVCKTQTNNTTTYKF